jgi:predicted nucleic acid-binding protein
MRVVSDTTALTTLIKAGLETILPQLFERVLIPEEVSRELLAFHPILPDACEVRQVAIGNLLTSLRLRVDPG